MSSTNSTRAIHFSRGHPTLNTKNSWIQPASLPTATECSLRHAASRLQAKARLIEQK